METSYGSDLPDNYHSTDTSSGNRYQSYFGKNLLVYVKGVCSNHHQSTDQYKHAVGTYAFGSTCNDTVHCTVIDRPTNERAVLEAVLRALERRLWSEDYSNVIIVSHDQYLVNGLNFRYRKWVNESWLLPDGSPRPNRKYWDAIYNLCDEYNDKGTEIGTWEVNKEYFDSLDLI